MKPTEYEFTADRRIYRVYLINGKWRVTMTENDEFFDRDQSREFMIDASGNRKWSDMPRWRSQMGNMDDFFEEIEKPEGDTAKYELAEFDSPEEAQEEVTWYWLEEDHKKRDDDYFS